MLKSRSQKETILWKTYNPWFLSQLELFLNLNESNERLFFRAVADFEQNLIELFRVVGLAIPDDATFDATINYFVENPPRGEDSWQKITELSELLKRPESRDRLKELLAQREGAQATSP